MTNIHDNPALPRVFIVGGGFAGIAAAKALAKAPVRVTLVDRRNHHVFQPLLYQVATAALSPADISSPIRSVVSKIPNCRVVLAKIRGVDLAQKRLTFEGGAVEYDYLILAAGATHSYFGHPEFEKVAPGLKTLEDATEMRKRILLAFESAEYEGSEERRKAALTFAIVGGGPTGVELAGAIQEIAANTIQKDFRNIDTTTTRVILLQGGDRLLPQFPPKLSERSRTDLEHMGVEVMLNAIVTNVTADGVEIKGQGFLPVRTVFWAAGVQGSPVGATLGVPLTRSGQVVVNPDLSVPGHPEVFVAGDLAAAKSADTGAPVPGVAPAALQMGKYVGKLLAAEIKNGTRPDQRKPFAYWDKGTLATIGRFRAVGVVWKLKFAGIIAYLLWAGVHIMYLVNFRNRLAVAASWFWNWMVNARDARLITGDAKLDIKTPRPGEMILAREGAEHHTNPEPVHAPPPPVVATPG
ncbi:MAG: NAD(P)/FAD-dependent oxidoreductase [Phycisphaerae bacterium]|nr:NAD(P)/FAD-dependent oxidoreductase [Tepidisphaeraceae bacterium]